MIAIKPSHKGLLHKEMGVPQGQTISLASLSQAKSDADPAEQKRITFAENAKGWRKVGGKKG